MGFGDWARMTAGNIGDSIEQAYNETDPYALLDHEQSGSGLIANYTRSFSDNRDAGATSRQRSNFLNSGYLAQRQALRQIANGDRVPYTLSPHTLNFNRATDASGLPRFVKPRELRRRNTKATLAIVPQENSEDNSSYSQEFILTDMQEEHSEKYQLLETFGHWNIIMFGPNPVFLTCSGVLLNGIDISTNWANAFRRLYRSSLRATVATENNTEVVLFVDGRMVTGAVLKLTLRQGANPDTIVSFSWVMVITSDEEVRIQSDQSPEASALPADLSFPDSSVAFA